MKIIETFIILALLTSLLGMLVCVFTSLSFFKHLKNNDSETWKSYSKPKSIFGTNFGEIKNAYKCIFTISKQDLISPKLVIKHRIAFVFVLLGPILFKLSMASILLMGFIK